MIVRPSFEVLKVISVGKDGDKERVPVSLSPGNKRIGEWCGPALFQFNLQRV